MLYSRDIEKVIIHTLQEHSLHLNYEFNNELAVPMSFNVSSNTIKYNYLQINGYKSKFKNKIRETDEDFVKLLLYHELGYYLDFKKNKHDLRILMFGDEEEIEQLTAVIERNAWEYGRTLVPQHLLESYDKIYETEIKLVKL